MSWRDDHPIHETLRRHRAERIARLARLRRWLRHLPRRSNVGSYPVLRWFAEAARRRPFLWTFRAPGPRRAVYLGSVISLMPIYGFQIFLALAAAIVFRANLAILIALQAITNPLTAGPVYYGTYRVGRVVTDFLELGGGYGPVGASVNALVIGGLLCGLALGGALDLGGRFLAWEARQLRLRHALAHREAEQLARETPATAGAAEDESGPPPRPADGHGDTVGTGSGRADGKSEDAG